MAHTFSIIPAKPTFGTIRKNLYQSDYLTRKTAAIIYCSKKAPCGKLAVAKDFNERQLFNSGRDVINFLKCRTNIPISKSNLVMGQYTKLNLCGVKSVLPIIDDSHKVIDSDPIATQCYLNSDTIYDLCYNNSKIVKISQTTTTTPFYQNNFIDPCGQLFGNTQCGELNFTSNMVYYPPTSKVL